MDYLTEIFKMQRRLQDAVGFDIFERTKDWPHDLILNCPRQDFILMQFTGIITEACEALENTPWKPWKHSARLDKEEFRKELIDLLHFVVNMFLAAGMTPQDIHEAFKKKHKENMRRQREGY